MSRCLCETWERETQTGTKGPSFLSCDFIRVGKKLSRDTENWVLLTHVAGTFSYRCVRVGPQNDGRPEWIRTIDLFRVKEAL